MSRCDLLCEQSLLTCNLMKSSQPDTLFTAHAEGVSSGSAVVAPAAKSRRARINCANYVFW